MTQSIQEKCGSSNQLQTKISFAHLFALFLAFGKATPRLIYLDSQHPRGSTCVLWGRRIKLKNNSFFIVFKISSFPSCSSCCYYPDQLTCILCLWNYPNFKQGESLWHKILSQTNRRRQRRHTRRNCTLRILFPSRTGAVVSLYSFSQTPIYWPDPHLWLVLLSQHNAGWILSHLALGTSCAFDLPDKPQDSRVGKPCCRADSVSFLPNNSRQWKCVHRMNLNFQFLGPSVFLSDECVLLAWLLR